MITHLYRYPVKGLSGERLDSLTLKAGLGLEGDREVAIARNPGVFDPSAPKAAPKQQFLMLARDEALAKLETSFDAATRVLTVRDQGAQALTASVATPEGRAEIDRFFGAYLGKPDVEATVVSAPGHKFTDISVVSPEKMRAISIVNLASIRALEEALGRKVDHRRFRANVYLDGVPAWRELDWLDHDLKLGPVEARCVMRTKRCPATEVNPKTAERDIRLPFELKKHFEHFDMGVYAEIRTSGELRVGDTVVAARSD